MRDQEIDDTNFCNSRLFFADDFGDNPCTMKCQLRPGHKGKHKEVTKRKDLDGNSIGSAIVTWLADERIICKRHGIQPSKYGCQVCMESPIMCSKHGVSEDNICRGCLNEPFTCPVHGLQESSFCNSPTDDKYCPHGSDDLHTKIYS